MDLFLNRIRALSDANRVRVLLALRQGELCVCRIIELLQLAPSTVSKHLSILKQAGLIESRKEGRWMHYRLPGREQAGSWNTLEWVFENTGDAPEIAGDRARMKKILATPIDKLTEIYRKRETS
jgi:DNA-binding transcriptional ArsR family regulator